VKSNPNPNLNHNPTTKQHALLNIQLNIVARATYPEIKRLISLYRFTILSVVVFVLLWRTEER